MNAVNGNSPRIVALMAMVGLMALTWGLPTRAAGDEMSSLQQQIKTLTQRVNRLEQEVKTLKHTGQPPRSASHSATSTSAAGTTPSAKTQLVVVPRQERVSRDELRSRWRSIKRNLTPAEVTKILGEPSRRFQLNGGWTFYYHYPNIGNGSVSFTGDNRVVGWQGPPLGGLW